VLPRVKKNAYRGNVDGIPSSTHLRKNATLSTTSLKYDPSGFSDGNDFFSHFAGTLPSYSALPTLSSSSLMSTRPFTALPKFTSELRITVSNTFTLPSSCVSTVFMLSL
jgi:hypothetical protein